ncbi:MAG: hypothetical protein IPH35_15940 [Rhodoferax sp.]|nr:hypothetical protein [Rhodoferax sp.]
MGLSAISATSATSSITNAYANRAYAGSVGQKRAQEPSASANPLQPGTNQEAPSPTQEQTPDAAKRTEKKASDGKAELTLEQVAQLTKLRARDREVRQHEAAHLAASGGLAVSGASFSYQKGPDGVNYAVGGEVQIDTSSGRTPQESLERARTIQAAALAPSQPSGQDRAVAAAAQKMELQARAELAQQATQTDKRGVGKEKTEEPDPANPVEKETSPANDKATRNNARAAQAYAAVSAITDITDITDLAGLALDATPATARRSQVSAYA